MRAFAAFLIAIAPLCAQDRSQTAVKRELGMAATRAIANFRAAESIEFSLNQDGGTLHARHASLRAQIEGALDDAQSALDKGDFDRARQCIQRAEALVERFEKGF